MPPDRNQTPAGLARDKEIQRIESELAAIARSIEAKKARVEVLQTQLVALKASGN